MNHENHWDDCPACLAERAKFLGLKKSTIELIWSMKRWAKRTRFIAKKERVMIP